VTLAEQIHADEDGTRARRCIVTGEVLPDAQLIRFVADPSGAVVPDILGKLPGRGMWVRARHDVLEKAVAKNHFSKTAKRSLAVAADLCVRVEALLVRRMLDDVGLARRGGSLVLGFDAILRAFQLRNPPNLLVEAADGAEDGMRKLLAAATVKGLNPAVIRLLSSAELSLALGRENVVHAAVKPGRLSERLSVEAGRLGGFRPAGRHLDLVEPAGPNPAPDEGCR